MGGIAMSSSPESEFDPRLLDLHLGRLSEPERVALEQRIVSDPALAAQNEALETMFRALGAVRTQIGWQFLREGAALAVAGAGLGLLLVMLVAPWLAKIVDIPARIPIHWAVLSAVGAVLAGSLASLGPALHAARIEPVEALRYE